MLFFQGNESNRTDYDLQNNSLDLEDQESNQSNNNPEICRETSVSNTSGCNTSMASLSRASTPSSSTSLDIGPIRSSLKRKNKRDQDQQALLDRCVRVMSKTADSYEIFGDYVADELRNMHLKAPDLEGRAKREIQRIILSMNDSYESRLQDANSSQTQMPVEDRDNISSELQSEAAIDNDDDTSVDINLANYYENCGSTYFNM